MMHSKINIDPGIYRRAERTIRDEYPEATPDDVDELADAWQTAFDKWVDARESGFDDSLQEA